MPGLTSGLNADARKISLDEMFFSVFDEVAVPQVADALSPIFFRQKPVTSGAVSTAVMGGAGAWDQAQEEEERTLTSIESDNKRTVEILKWNKTIPIPYEYWDDDQHDTVDEAIAKAGLRAKTTRDKYALQKYNNGFSAFTTNAGTALWSSSHTNLNGDTIDNLSSGALLATTFKTLLRMLMVQKSQDGEWGGHAPAGFLVPPELFPTAIEITDSQLAPYTTDNQLNWISRIYPDLRVFQSPFIGADLCSLTYATTAHYLISKNHNITRYEREVINTDLVEPRYDDKDRWKYKGKFREEVTVISYEGAVASTGV